MNARIRAYFELLRLPAVFTAIADILMGFLVVGGSFQPPWALALVVIASSLIYLAGMVLNDAYDAPVDTIERTHRPIPSGRIALESATRLGGSLLACGIAAAWLVSYVAGTSRPGIVATLLAASVILYDMILKRTPAAPFLMGCCRFLNVLLGMSLAETTDTMQPRPWFAAEWAIAAGVGIYIVGVTIFARTETQQSSRWRLANGIIIMLAGIVTALRSTAYLPQATSGIMGMRPGSWPIAAVMLALMLALPVGLAIAAPVGKSVQFAVRRALRILIILDMAVASTCSPQEYVLVFISLLAMMLLLERAFSTT